MKNTGKNLVTLGLGMVLGAALLGTASAATEYFKATRSTQPIHVDGQKVSMEAYAINGNNYVKLRDIGAAVDINVYWDGSAVQVDTGVSYSGEAPVATHATPVLTAVEGPTTVQTSQKVSPSSRDIEALRQEMVERTNAVRTEHGLSALTVDPMLMKAAQVRAEEMAATGCYSHTRPDGSPRKSVTNCPYTAENIHRIICDFIEERGFNVAEFALRGWTCSEGHLKNILNENMAGIGVGLAIGVNEFGEPSWYCVQELSWKGYAITWVDTPKIP